MYLDTISRTTHPREVYRISVILIQLGTRYLHKQNNLIFCFVLINTVLTRPSAYWGTNNFQKTT